MCGADNLHWLALKLMSVVTSDHKVANVSFLLTLLATTVSRSNLVEPFATGGGPVYATKCPGSGDHATRAVAPRNPSDGARIRVRCPARVSPVARLSAVACVSERQPVCLADWP
jgi:hypothetical protein